LFRNGRSLLREDDQKTLESLVTSHAGALDPSHHAGQCYAKDFDIMRNANTFYHSDFFFKLTCHIALFNFSASQEKFISLRQWQWQWQ
jgi:hypothetical protein